MVSTEQGPPPVERFPVVLGYALLQGWARYLWWLLAGLGLITDIFLMQLRECYASLNVICSLRLGTARSLALEVYHLDINLRLRPV